MTERGADLPQGYDFVGPLGSGGFGEVVLARHRMLGRLVAIKSIHQHALADADAIERFRREARVLASTSCPSVVRVYDLHTDDRGAQLVMEYCPGQSLADILEGGPLPAGEALQVLSDVADALAAMSARGIVHRDVKPGNVFVLPDGHAKLGDFGLARALADPSAFRTAGGAAMGTPAYFPPEVSQGTAEPDARSDAYSFAVMAYEVLTGERPFDGPDALSLIMAHWSEEPTPAGTVAPGFPEGAWRVLQRGMDKDPAHRPLPHEMVRKLAAIPSTSWPEATRSASTAPRPSAPTVRRPGLQPGVPVTGTAGSGAGPERSGRTRRRLALAAGVVAAAVVAGVLAHQLLTPDPGLEVLSARVEVDPPSGRGACPQEDFVFTAVLRTNGSAGTLRVQWVRPDGQETPVLPVRVGKGQREVRAQLPFRVSGSEPLEGEARVRVVNPQARTAGRSIRYVCPLP